jgi:hypothetical protein
MRNLLTLIFTALLLFLIAELGFYIYLTKVPKNQTKNLPTSQTLSSPTILSTNPSFQIIYQRQGDNEGRTIIYFSSNPYTYRGVGWNKMPSGMHYLTGIFSHWKSFSDQKDKLIYLVNPQTNQEFEPVLVAFSPSSLIKSAFTRLTVENISRVKELPTDSDQSIEDFDFLIPINKLSSKALDDLIREGDALVVIPVQRYEKGVFSVIKDDKKIIVASQILIRRDKGSQNLKYLQ